MAIEQGSTSINPHPNPNPDPDPNPDPNTNPNPNRTLCMEKYELGEILGRGNNSVVKLARNILTGDKVAIKIFDKEPLLRGKKMWIRELTKKKVYSLFTSITLCHHFINKECSVPLHLDLDFGYVYSCME